MLSKKQITLLFFVVLTFAIATPSVAWAGNVLNDSQEPGSVLVFPLFERGTVPCPPDLPYGCTPMTGTLPRTSFEISVVCPNGATCTDQQDVDIHFEWVCGGAFAGVLCSERNFILNTTVNGTIRFNPNGGTCQPAPGFTNPEGCGTIPVPQCSEGYLIAWVVNESGQPIKFDGLIGDAVLRESSTAVTAYNAIPIQAAPALATGALVPLGPGGALRFDGTGYAEVTGTIIGSVQLDFVNAAGFDQDQTSLVLLTLDTISNRFNFPVNVDLNFYNEGEQPNSNPFLFTCFAETGSLFGTFGLESSFSPGTGKALVQSINAEKVPVLGITDTAGPVTLLGLVITRECDPAAASCVTFVPGVGTEPSPLRNFAYPLLNDSKPVPTSFRP
jgi:hypothetical protein